MRSKRAADAHLLAISDLHLGGDLRRGSMQPADDVPAIDRRLAPFLDHHRMNRIDGRPWRLVIVGDMVDFIAITRTPERDQLVPFTVTDDEREWGLAPEPAKAAWKLSQTFQRHALFYRALAEFARDGNDVVIVRGNHDPEWTWPEVRAALRTHLSVVSDIPADSVRVRFRDWFYLEPGRFYAEHGHLYDEFSVSDDLLPASAHPDRPPRARSLREPLSTMAMRYFGNKHEVHDPNGLELWTFSDFILWAKRTGRFTRMATDYLLLCWRVLAVSIRGSLRATIRSIERLMSPRKARRVRERARLLAQLIPLPADRSVIAASRMLYFDRIMVGAALVGCLGACAISARPIHIRGGALAAAIAIAAGLNEWLTRLRKVDSHSKQIEAARKVAALLRVPVVVMGHTHRPVDERLGGGARYYNLGTWTGPGGRDRGFPHVVVGPDGSALRRWLTEESSHLDTTCPNSVSPRE